MQNGLWLFSIGQHKGKSLNMGIGLTVSQFILWMLEHCLNQYWKKMQGALWDFSVVDSPHWSFKIIVSTPFVFDLLVQAYAKLRMFEIAFEVCCYLEEHGFSSSLISFNTLIHVVQKFDQVPLVWNIYEHMIQKRTYPNEVTIQTMIIALCKKGNLQKYVEILDQIYGKYSNMSFVFDLLFLIWCLTTPHSYVLTGPKFIYIYIYIYILSHFPRILSGLDFINVPLLWPSSYFLF